VDILPGEEKFLLKTDNFTNETLKYYSQAAPKEDVVKKKKK
jgi:hypothetical protein